MLRVNGKIDLSVGSYPSDMSLTYISVYMETYSTLWLPINSHTMNTMEYHELVTDTVTMFVYANDLKLKYICIKLKHNYRLLNYYSDIVTVS